MAGNILGYIPRIIRTKDKRRIVSYRGTNNEIISRSKYESLTRRDPSGKFSDKPLNSQRAENWFRQKLGAPPAGQVWVRIADKYRDRFGDMIDDYKKADV